MSSLTSTHYEWITNEYGLTTGAIFTTHWTRGDMMETYLRLHRDDPRTVSIYEGEFMTIVETYLHEKDARVDA